MPELPDLEVFSKNLEKTIKGKTMKSCKIHNDRKLKVGAAKFQKTLKDAKITKVYREGKELHLGFDSGDVLGLHLMLHGNLYLLDAANDKKHPIIELQFREGGGLVMTDWQGQATPTLNPPVKEAPDALSKDVNAAYLKEVLGSSKAAVKNILLDQHVIRGIGNAYADEIFWQAKISPFSTANKIPAAKVTALAKAIKLVLNNAIKKIKKSHPNIITGEYREFLEIHNSKRKESPTGSKILNKTVNGRKTYYTEEQELYQ